MQLINHFWAFFSFLFCMIEIEWLQLSFGKILQKVWLYILKFVFWQPIIFLEWLTVCHSQSILYTLSTLNFIWLILLMQELHDIPLFFSLHNIAGTVKCTSPSLVMFRSAVLNAGYQISSTHVNPLGVKSDAPWDVIWDIMRCWVSLYCSSASSV